MNLKIRKPISISINATYKVQKGMFAEKPKETKDIIYFIGNEYSYDKEGNPYGKGVFYSHIDLMNYISKSTRIQD